MNRSIPNSPGEARLAKLKADVSKDMGLPSAWQILGTSKWENDYNLITTLKESSSERHLRNCHQSKQSCVSTLQERVYFPGYQVNLLQCTNIHLCVSNSSGCKPNFKSQRSLRMPGPHSLPTNVLFYCLGPPAGKKTKAITANCTSQ